jgi:hypothetical protein
VRIALAGYEQAVRPAAIDPMSWMEIQTTGNENEELCQAEYSTPATMTVRRPQNPTTEVASVAGAIRFASSRSAKPSIPVMANIDRIEKLSAPGWKAMITPMRPIRIAAHGRHPTFSRNIIATPATTTNGVACKITVADSKGVKATANIGTSDR